jgi:4-amino-4-deoxy-L-arabinose transferase-like glycosyltransferase
MLAVLIGWQFFNLLGSAPLWDRDEPRNAGCSLEMLARHDWIVPTFNQELRGHKPVLLYWAQMLSLSWLGPHAWGARLPSALFGALAVVAIGWLGSGLRHAATGWWSAAAMATCLSVVIAARAGTPDAPLLACTTAGIASLALYRTSNDRRLWWLGYLSLGGAVLAKGPVGLILPAGCLVLWSGWHPSPARADIDRRRWPRALSPSHWWQATQWLNLPLGLVVVLAVALPWFIWVGLRTDGAFLREFFLEHHLGRATRVMEGHRGGWWYYPAMLLVGTFPWSLMLIPIGLWVHQQFPQPLPSSPATDGPRPPGRRDAAAEAALITLGLAWLVVYIAAFSLARTKLPSYITPAYPGAALLIGATLSDWSSGQWRINVRWMWLAGLVNLLVGSCLAISIIWLALNQHMPDLAWQAVWAAALLIAAGAWSLAAAGRLAQPHLPAILLASYATLLGGLLSFGAAAAGNYRSDLTQLADIQRQLLDSGFTPSDWFSPDPVEPSWIFYLGRPISTLPGPAQPTSNSDHPAGLPIAPDWVLRLQQNRQAVALIKSSRLTDHLLELDPQPDWEKTPAHKSRQRRRRGSRSNLRAPSLRIELAR